jgi:hypothetical protein
MEQQKITVGNKLIAEFMKAEMPSYSKNPDGTTHKCALVYCGNRVDYIYVMDKWSEYGNLFKFHSSWDWLMPVVIHINKMKKMININLWSDFPTTECKIYNWGLGEPQQTAECENPLDAVWEAVVNFIEWNNQKEFMLANGLGEQDVVNDNKPTDV